MEFEVQIDMDEESTVTLTRSPVPNTFKIDLNDASNCCVNVDTYRVRGRTTHNDNTKSGWSGWTSFTYSGASSLTPTPEPLSYGWGTAFGVQMPVYTSHNDKFNFLVEINRDNFSGVCSISSPGEYVSSQYSVNCPVGTFVSFAAPAPCGNYGVKAVLTLGDEEYTLPGTIRKPCPSATETQYFVNLTATAAAANRSRDKGSSGKRAIATPTASPAYLYPTQDHSQLPDGATVESDTPWIAFREVSGAAISDPAVRDAAMQAIDVWGPLGVDAEVCFAGYGSLSLLDAAYSPRRLVALRSYLRGDGKVCARLDRAGTVVLLPGAPSFTIMTATPTAAPRATRDPFLIADDPDTMVALEDCMVNSVWILNFRERPAGPIISWYLGRSVALGRTENWYKVRYLDNEGWVSAHYVTPEGDCG